MEDLPCLQTRTTNFTIIAELVRGVSHCATFFEFTLKIQLDWQKMTELISYALQPKQYAHI